MIEPIGVVRELRLGGGEVLRYIVRQTGRRRTVAVVVEPDGQITVLAPRFSTQGRIEQILRRHLRWIRRQQREIEALPPPPLPREWVNGETHRYLGRQYRLKVLRAAESSVKLLGAFFVVSTPDQGDRAAVRHLMEGWYRQRAKTLLPQRTRLLLSRTTWLDVKLPPIQIRALRDRWGSASPSGRIAFNLDLVKLPLSCVDYVVAHELVHLAIPSHSPAYWRMLERVMPDWRRWRQRLATVEL